MFKCANYMNQEAIDEVIRKHNKEWMKEADFTLYEEGKNRCVQCDFGLGLEDSPSMILLKHMAGHPIKRICYKEPTEGRYC